VDVTLCDLVGIHAYLMISGGTADDRRTLHRVIYLKCMHT